MMAARPAWREGRVFEWITGVVEQTGYLGIALLMIAENLFPPIPSELIMPLAGFVAARGELSLVGVILAGTIGSLIGALFWYVVARAVGGDRVTRWAERHGRWLTVSGNDVERARTWFGRHGGKAVLIGRLVPAVRSLISIPAGVVPMRLAPFLAFSAIGTALWTAGLAVLGYLLEGAYERVADYVDPLSKVVIGLIVAYYLYRVITHRRRSKG